MRRHPLTEHPQAVALAERRGELLGGATAQDLDRDGSARRRLADQPDELGRAAHALAVEADDDVSLLDPGLRGGAVRLDRAHLRPARIALDVVETNPQETTATVADDDALLDSLLVAAALAGPDGGHESHAGRERQRGAEGQSHRTLHVSSSKLARLRTL